MKRLIASLLSFRPTQKTVWLAVGFAVAGLILGAVRITTASDGANDSLATQNVFTVWRLAAIIAIVCLVYDLYIGIPLSRLLAHRELPSSFSLNREQSVQFVLTNESSESLHVVLHDATPSNFETSAFPLAQTIKAGQKGIFEYNVIPKSRGTSDFQPAYVQIKSKLGLWQFVRRMGNTNEAKVYPDFSAVSNSFVFGVEQAMRNMGAHIAKRKGDGMEFNQLREFRDGDTLKQIDWKATARLGEPISREYQEEKDQNIVFLLDCSRRMRAMENNLSYFDYALNALLMSSYIALDKGDAVGVMTFSGQPSWLPPIKGKIAVNTILNHLFDLETSTQSSDYVTAAEELMLKHRKRSLIILITNVRDDDNEDLGKAVSLLREQHLVMIVALQERLLEKIDDLPTESLDDVLLYSGAKHFEFHRQKMLAKLKASGVSVVDATHKNLHIKLVTEYLRLKQSKQI